MPKRFDLSEFIDTIEINGLSGRYINAPGKSPRAKNLNILFIHGHHSSLERNAGICELLMNYGNFCLPDLPGFGGMNNFYSIGLKPTIDNYADYVAAFIKFHYGKKKKFVLIGYSMGFLVVTRMLQKYPELHSQIKEVISVAGLVHKNDFAFTKKRLFFYKISAHIVKTRLVSWVVREVFLRKWFLSTVYTRTHNAKAKFAGVDKSDLQKLINFEVILWRINHIPTWCYTSLEMFKADLVTNQQQLPIDLISVTVDLDQYFDNKTTEQHMKIVYRKVKIIPLTSAKHSVSVVASAEEAKAFLPPVLISHLKSMQ